MHNNNLKNKHRIKLNSNAETLAVLGDKFPNPILFISPLFPRITVPTLNKRIIMDFFCLKFGEGNFWKCLIDAKYFFSTST